MTKKPQIKAIIFDVGGVLFLPKNPTIIKKRGHCTLGVHQQISNKLKISLDQWFDLIDSIYADSIEGRATEKKALSVISRNIKTNPGKLKKIILRAYLNNFTQNKKLYSLAFKLKKLGYKIAILSDQWPVSQEALMPKKLYKNFDQVIVSCNVGMRKPNPKIYRLLLKKLKLPAKTLFLLIIRPGISNQQKN